MMEKVSHPEETTVSRERWDIDGIASPPCVHLFSGNMLAALYLTATGG